MCKLLLSFLGSLFIETITILYNIKPNCPSDPFELNENVFHHEQGSEDIERRVELLPVAAQDVYGNVCYDAAENAVGDAV